MLEIPTENGYELFHLEQNIKTIFVIGGSQGSEKINDHILDIMPKLVEKYQVIHQTGNDNLEWMKKRAQGVLSGNQFASRYKPFGYLDSKTLRIAADVAAIVISRAGSTIFEIALWKKPSILIPLSIARGDHQRENAYSYARTGAATVIEEANLRNELLFSVIDGLMQDEAKRKVMADATVAFAHSDAADKIAQALLHIAQKHDD
jgi:UDP-N-acetylglucosamine--N-acetylmuramyl-(pentapeptide) pyrophosphoryl-undecaprenol N-acetylglucosamine transferase